ERTSDLLKLQLVRYHGRRNHPQLKARSGAKRVIAVAIYTGYNQRYGMACGLQAVGEGYEWTDVAAAAPSLYSDLHVRALRPLRPNAYVVRPRPTGPCEVRPTL